MAGRSLRAQLNQIRAWVREGRTDAWIAHQLEVSAAELRDFRRRHGLAAESEPEAADDLRDEIEAEVEAATLEAEEEEEAAEEEEEAAEEEEEAAEEEEEAAEEERGEEEEPEGEGEGAAAGEAERREGGGRRRRRRGGRGRRRGKRLEATFDHGEREGYGLWLDASVKDNPVYAEHWAGHRDVEVTIEPDQIVIRRSGQQS
jgi:hypothetical protein